jgi:S1-C subfamily serine protease
MTLRQLSRYCSCLVFIAACAFPALSAHAQSAPNADAQIAEIPVHQTSSQFENSVVKIFSTIRSPDPFRPWSKSAPQEITGSGVVIEGNRILTNAHVVGYASQIQIQARQGGDKISASVVAIARGIDLAVLKLDDNSFFATHKAQVRANILPDIKDAVFAYGYPTGGSSLSITKGIVSRIEFVPYNYYTSGLRIQIDAAINPGNSGGPVIAGDKMIGLAFSTATNVQNIGYIIPNEEIELFLQDIADGHYVGKPAMFDALQTLENPALRTYLKLDKSVRGMVVQKPVDSSFSYPLKEWDVVTHIGDTPIDDQGLVKLGPDLNVRFQYRVQQVAKNGKLPLTVIRNGKSIKIQLPVRTSPPEMIPSLLDNYPSYFICGPIVFSRATNEFRTLITSNAATLNAYAYNASPLVTKFGAPPEADREELVVISAPFFPHKLVAGYDNRFGSVIYSINDKPVRSLRHLVILLRDLKDDLVVIKFDQRSGENIVLPRKELLAATDEILNDNGIRSQGSKDMMEVWQSTVEK